MVPSQFWYNSRERRYLMRFEWDPKKAAANLNKHGVRSKRLPRSSETLWPLRFKIPTIQRMKKDK
jgi:hypothetical protein